MASVLNPARAAVNKLYPASIYARPAVAPLMVGVGGQVGLAQKNLTDTYKYTLRQMAISPFSVNSEGYMERIRDEYGYSDNGMYEAMGTVGGVVGVGVGAYMRLGGWRGFISEDATYNPKTWLQNPFVKLSKDNVKLQSSRYASSKTIGVKLDSANKLNSFIDKNKILIDNYNKTINLRLKSSEDLRKLNKKFNETDLKLLSDKYAKLEEIESRLEKATKNVKRKRGTSYVEKIELEKTAKVNEIKKIQEAKNIDFDEYTKALKDLKKSTADITKQATEITQAASKVDDAADLVKTADVISDVVGTGKVIAKASKLAPIVGVAGDVASLGINIAGAAQAFDDNQYLAGTMYLLGAALDAGSVALEFIPGIGTVAGVIVSALSLAVGAFADFLAGQTVGHSLTPEGAKAQQLFAQNLYGSIADRPITTVATILTTVGVPAGLNAMQRIPGQNLFAKGARAFGEMFTHDAWGSYVRSTTTMMATQGINALTMKIEDSFKAPEDASEINFVTAFSVVGDLNDNLFGATARKSALLGLAKGDPKAQTDALAKAWGFSGDDIYYNPTFDDIRQAAGIDLGNIGNSILGIVGEVFIDPQNKVEAQERILKEHVTHRSAEKTVSAISLERARILEGKVTPDSKVVPLLLKQTEDGTFVKRAILDTKRNRYVKETFEDPSNPNRFVELDVYKTTDGKYIDLERGTEIKSQSLNALYDSLEYSATKFGRLDNQSLKQHMSQYVYAYLDKGIEGVRAKHIELNTANYRGTRHVSATKSDQLFADNMAKFIEQQLSSATPMDIAEFNTLKQSIEDPKANTKKFEQIYRYYGLEQGDTAALIFKLQQDFNLQINTEQYHKLYNLSKSFSEKLDLIGTATGRINKLANPLGWLADGSIKALRDIVTTSRNTTSVRHSAERIIKVKQAIENNKYNVNQSELDEARKNLEEQTKVSIEANVTKAAIKDGDKDFKEVKKLYNEVEKIRKNQTEYLKQLKDYRDTQSLRVYHKKYDTVYIDVNKDNIKDLEQEYTELSNKAVKTPMELSRVNLLASAITQYNSKYYGYTEPQIQALTKLGLITDTLNHMFKEASETSNNLIQQFNKFDTILAVNPKEADAELDIIEKTLEQLNIHSDPDFKIVKGNDQNVYMEYKVDLAEYICSLFNRAIFDKFQENFDDLVINEVYIIKQVLKGMNFADWVKLDDVVRYNIVKEIAINLCEQSGIKNKRAFLYLESNVSKEITNTLNKVATKVVDSKEKYITISEPLVNVDDGFRKRVVMNTLVKNNKAFKQYLNIFRDQINNLNKFIDDLKDPNGIDDTSHNLTLELVKSTLNNRLQKIMKNHPMYSLLQEYIYSDVSKQYTFMESIYDKDLYTTLDKDTFKYVTSPNTSKKEDVVRAQQKLATSKLVDIITEVYKKYESENTVEVETHNALSTPDPQATTKPEPNKIADAENLLRKNVKEKYKVDKLKSNQEIHTNYNLIGDEEEAICKLAIGISGAVDEANGYMDITLRPTTFIDEHGKVWYFAQLFDPITSGKKTIDGVYKLKHYKTTVEEQINKIVEAVRKGECSIIYKNRPYDKHNIDNISKSLVNHYMTTKADDKGIVVRYNKIYERATSNSDMYQTAKHYKDIMQREMLTTVGMNFKEGKLKLNDTEYLTIPKEHSSSSVDILKYILKNKQSLNSEALSKFLKGMYDRAKTYTDKTLVYDKGLEINSTLIPIINKLLSFEVKTIQSRYLSTPVVATDYVKRAVSNDNNLMDLLKDITSDSDNTVLGAFIKALKESIIEVRKGATEININQFTSISRDSDGDYIFTGTSGSKSLTDLILNHTISLAQLDELLNKVLKNSSGATNVEFYSDVITTYTNIMNIIDPSTKQEFVDMLKSTKNMSQDEAEKIYDTLYSNPQALSIVSKLRYNHRSADKLSFSEKYPVKVVELYKESIKDTTYLKKYAPELTNNDTKKFLLYILEWKPATEEEKNVKKFLLTNIFFTDFKTSKGIFSQTNINKIANKIKTLKEVVKNLDGTKKQAIQNKILENEAYLEHLKKYSAGIKSISKEDWVNYLLDNYDESKAEDVINVFSNTKQLSNRNRYEPVIKSDGSVVYIKADTVGALEKVVAGAGKFNVHIINRFSKYIEENETAEQDKEIFDNGGNNVLVVSNKAKAELSAYREEIKNNTNAKYIYIITPEQYKEIRDIYNAKDKKGIATYTITKDTAKDKDGNPIEWKLQEVDTRINTEAYKVVAPAYLKDLELISSYGQDVVKSGNLKDIFDIKYLYEFGDTYYENPMLQKSFMAGNTLTQSKLFGGMKRDAEVSIAFTEFIEPFKDVNGEYLINLQILGDYFKDEYIKEGKDIKASVHWKTLEEKDINGTKASELIKNQIEKFRAAHIAKPYTFAFDYDQVFSNRLMNNIITIKRIINNMVKKGKTAVEQNMVLSHTFKQLNESYANRVVEEHVKEDQQYNEELYTKYNGNMTQLKEYYRLNKQKVDNTYIARNNAKLRDLNRKDEKRFNYKTMYSVINLLESNTDIIVDIKNNSITFTDTDTIRKLFGNDTIKELLLNLYKQSKLTTHDDIIKEINNIFKKEIIYPFIQNISLDFNKENMYDPFFYVGEKIQAMTGDPRYEAYRDDYIFFDASTLLKSPTVITIDDIVSNYNPNYIDLITSKTVQTKIQKIINASKHLPVDKANKLILKSLDDLLLSLPRFKENTHAHMFTSEYYSKRRNTIEDSDFNKYNYADGTTLKRESFIVMRDGYDKEDQENVVTIAKHIADTYNQSNLEIYVDRALHTVADLLCDTAPKNVENRNEANILEAELKAIAVHSTEQLNDYIISEASKELKKLTYVYPDFPRVLRNALETQRAMYVAYKNPDNFLDKADKFYNSVEKYVGNRIPENPEKLAEIILDVVVRITDKYNAHYMYLRNQDKQQVNHKYKNNGHFVQSINTNVYNENIDFYNQLKTTIKNERKLNTTLKNLVLNEFNNAKTLTEFYRSIYNYITEDNKKDFFALIVTINHYKEEYHKQKNIEYNNPNMEYTKQDDIQFGYNVNKLNKLKDLYGLGIDYSKNIFKDLQEPIESYSTITKAVKGINSDLARVIGPRDTYIKQVEPDFVVNKENGFTTAVKQMQRETTYPLFKMDENYKPGTDIYIKINKELQTAYSELVQEISANTIEECYSYSANGSESTYGRIRKMFTEILHECGVDNKGFVRIEQISTALQRIRDFPELGTFYKNQYDFIAGDLPEGNKLNSIYKEIIKYFNDRQYLTEMNEGTIKAVMGYIFHMYYNTKPIKVKQKELEQAIEGVFKNKFAVDYKLSTSNINSIRSIVDDAVMNKEQKLEKIINIIYSKPIDEESDEYKHLSNLLDLTNSSNIRALSNDGYLHDTFEFIDEESVGLAWDEYKKRSQYIKTKRDGIDKVKSNINFIESELRKHKSINVNTVDNFGNTNTEKITIDNDTDINALIEDIKNNNINLHGHVNTINDELSEKEKVLNENMEVFIAEFLKHPLGKQYADRYNANRQKYFNDIIDTNKDELDKAYNKLLSATKKGTKYFTEDTLLNYKKAKQDKLYTNSVSDENDEAFKEWHRIYKGLPSSLKSTCDKFINALENIYKNEQHRDKYVNMNPNDVDLQSSYANEVFTYFKRELYEAREEEAKKLSKEFVDNLHSFKSSVNVKERTVKNNKKKFDARIKGSLTYLKTAFNDLSNEFNLNIPELDIDNPMGIEQALSLIENVRDNYKKQADDIHAEYEKLENEILSNPNYTKSKVDLTIDEAKQAIHGRYHKDFTKSKDLLEYIFKKSIEDNKPIEYYFKKSDALLHQIILYKYHRHRFSYYYAKNMDVSSRYNNVKEHYDIYKHYNTLNINLSNMEADNDVYYNTLKHNIENNLDVEIDKLYSDEIKNKFMFNIRNNKDIIKYSITKAEYNKHIKANEESIKTLKSIKNNRDSLEEDKGKLTILEDSWTKQESELREAHDNLKHIKTTMSNSKLYRRYSIDESKRQIDEDSLSIVEDVKARVVEDGLLSKEELDKLIKDNGASGLHNPVVDCLITMYNYLYQIGAINSDGKIDITKLSQDRFIVMDMETVQDITDDYIPYQVTIVEVVKKEGKLVPIITTLYYNSYVFFNSDVDNPDPYLQRFIEQQYSMYQKDEPNITEDEVKDRVAAIIKNANGRTNTLEQGLASIQLLNNRTCPIIAHNGKKFDFANYDNFMTNYARKLIQNELFKSKYANVNIVKETLTKEAIDNLGLDEATYNAVKQELEDLNKMYREGKISTELEISKYDQCVQRLLDYMTKYTVKKHIDNAVLELNKNLSQQGKATIQLTNEKYKELVDGNNSVFNKIIDYCYDYIIVSANTDIDTYVNNLDVSTLGIALDKDLFKMLLTYVTNDLQVKKDGTSNYKSTMQTIQDNIIERYKLPKNVFEQYDNVERVAIINRNISEISQLITHIKAIAETNPNDASQKIYKEFNDIVASTNKQIQDLDNDIATYQAKIDTLEKSIADYEANNNKLNEQLSKLVQRMQEYTLNNVSKAYTALSRNLNKALEQANTDIRVLDNTLLEENINIARQEIADILNVLEAFVSAINNPDTVQGLPQINDLLLNIRIQDYNSAKSKDSVVEDIRNRIIAINEYKDDQGEFVDAKLEAEWTSTWNFIRNNASNNISSILKQTRTLIEHLKKEAPNEVVKVLEMYHNDSHIFNTDDIKKLREALNKLSLANKDVNAYMKSNNNIQKLNTTLAKNSELNINAEIMAQQDAPEINKDNLDVIKLLLEKELSTLSSTMMLINSMEIKNNKYTYNNIDTYIENILKRVNTIDDTLEDIQTRIIEKAALRPNTSSIIDPNKDIPEYIKEVRAKAAEVLDKDDPKYELYEDVERFYRDLNEGNDIYAVTEAYDKAFLSEDNNAIRISFNTEYYHITQTLVIPKNSDGTLANKDKWKYQFQYGYNYKGKGFEKFKIHPTEFKVSDKTHFYTTLNKDVNKQIAPGPRENLELENGVDYNKHAIERLQKFTEKLMNSKDVLKHIRENTVNIRDCDTEHLTKVNLHDVVRRKFRYQLQLINAAQGNRNLIPYSSLYKSIYRQVMGNLNAVKPGMYILQIPEEHASNLIQKMSAKGENDLAVDIFKVSEGSMGNALTAKTVYSTKALFGANTNPVRTLLATNIIHSKFTPIVINNQIFERCGKDVHSNYEDYIYNLDTDQDKFDVWVKKKLTKENPDADEKSDWFKERKCQLEEIERLRYELLVGDKEYINGVTRRNLFTLRVGGLDTIENYRDDVYHPLGVNLTVACTSDVRAYEDTILIDKKYSHILGMFEGNKLWLKYGFKGAIKVEEGIEDMYGASIVTVTSSVEDRGSKGMYLEMFSNKLIDYCVLKNEHDKIDTLGQVAFDIFKNCKAFDELQNKYMFKSWEDFEKFKAKNKLPRMYIVKDSLIFEDTDYKNSEEFLNHLINNKCDLFGVEDQSLYDTNGHYIKPNLDYKEVIKAKATKGKSYSVYDPVSKNMITKTYDDTNRDIFRGTLYVMLDPEHQAAHMQSQLALQLTEDKGLTYVVKDAKGNVRKGGQQSFTVEQSYAQKIGYEFAKYIVDAEEDSSLNAQYEATWKIFLYGMDAFNDLVVQKDGKVDIDTTVNNILLSTQLSSGIKSLLREYYSAVNKLNEDPKAELRKQDTEKAIKNEARKGWGSNKGIGYAKNYKKYNASRNQLLADVRLSNGEIKFPADSWDNLKSIDTKKVWADNKPITLDKINESLSKHADSYGLEKFKINLNTNGTIIIPNTYKDKKSEYLVEIYKLLRFLGIYEGYEVKGKITTFIQDSEATTYIEDIKFNEANLKQTTAYVLGVRYPVQDINATPILKITGVVEHSAVVCNTAMYSIMGADNDGDAASFTMIKYDEVIRKDSELEHLNASLDTFYDPDYLQEKSNKDLKINKGIVNSFETVNPIEGTKAAYIGKKTAPISKYIIKDGEVIENKKQSVRAGDNHYTYTELMSYDPKLIRELKNTVVNKNLPISFTGCESNDIFWVNSHIWVNNKGRNTADGVPKDFYNKPELISNYYNKYKSEIEELKKIEWYLNYTKDGRKFVEEHLEDIIKNANYTTLSRGRVSKLNVGVTGGYRKGVYLGTTLSIFPKINRDPSGKIWNTEYDVELNAKGDGVVPFTVYSIFEKLFDKASLDTKSIQDIKELCTNYSKRKQEINSKYSNALDVEKVSEVVLDHYLEMRIAENCLEPLIKVFLNKDATYKNLKDVYDNDLLLEPMTYVKEYGDKHQDEKIPPAIMQLVKEYYLSRFIPDFNRTAKEHNNNVSKIKEEYFKGIQDELFLTRSLSKVLNDLIQEPISYSKHGSAIADYTEIDEELRNNAEQVSNNLIKRKVFVGNSYKHSRAIAMGAEYDTDKRAIKFQAPEEVKTAKTAASNAYINDMAFDPSKPVTTYDIEKRIKLIIQNDMCGPLIDGADADEALVAFKAFAKFITDCISSNRSFNFTSISENSEIINHIKTFENLNISLYKVIKTVNIILDKCREAKGITRGVKLPSWLQDLIGIKCLVGIDKQELRKTINAASSEELKYLINYLTEVDNPIDEDATGSVEYSYRNDYSSEDLYQALEEAAGIFEDGIIHYAYPEKSNDQILNDEFINKLGIPQKDYQVSPTDTIVHWVSQIKLLLDQYKQDTKDIKSNVKTLSEIKQEIINKKIGFSGIKQESKQSAQVHSEINKNKELKVNAEKELRQLQRIKNDLQKQKQDYEDTLKGLSTNTPENTIEKLEAYKSEQEQKLKDTTKQNIMYSLLGNMRELDELLLNNSNNNSNIKVLEASDVRNFQDNLLLNMDMYQHPFSVLVDTFRHRTDAGGEDIDWDSLYKYLVKNHSYIRVTEVVKAKESEGLARRLIDYISIKDTNLYTDKHGVQREWNALTRREKLMKVNRVKHKQLPKLETFEDLKKLTKDAIFTFDNKEYKIDLNTFNPKDFEFITPTLKEIKIKSAKDLKTLWEDGVLKGKAIGFTYINDIMSATEDAYKPYTMTGRGAIIARTFNSVQKAVMRYSAGFLLRNAMDTFNQLLADMYIEQGMGYMVSHPAQVFKYLQYGNNIYSVYQNISEERLFTLSDIKLTYLNIEKTKDPKELNALSRRLYRYLETYIKQGKAMDEPTLRIKERTKQAEEIAATYTKMINAGYVNKHVCYQMYRFLGSIKFAEYYEFYDNKVIGNELVYGLRIDAETRSSKHANKLAKKMQKQDELFKPLLFKISYFMNTNAQVDMFKEKQYKELGLLVKRTEADMLNKTEDETIETIDKEINQLRKDTMGTVGAWMSKHNANVYQWLTERTENLARILGFILHEDLYGYSFDMSVQKSLKSWFNYGQRSPIEMQLMYDIPYISFPVRSIDNWRSRLLNPRYARFMDDLIDGVYSQYADEDGQYSEYEQFMIKSGWIPITNNLGIRAGSGAFDIMNLITNTPENINQRRNPIIRGLQKYLESGDLAQATKQLATVGLLNRAAQRATLGAYNANKGIVTKPSVAKASSMFFEYNNYDKYTPKKYSYLYNNNGRAKYYENIYRDWFTKYGKMRKPTVDPVQLVKNIQWKQFVRRMQIKYRR